MVPAVGSGASGRRSPAASSAPWRSPTPTNCAPTPQELSAKPAAGPSSTFRLGSSRRGLAHGGWLQGICWQLQAIKGHTECPRPLEPGHLSPCCASAQSSPMEWPPAALAHPNSAHHCQVDHFRQSATRARSSWSSSRQPTFLDVAAGEAARPAAPPPNPASRPQLHTAAAALGEGPWLSERSEIPASSLTQCRRCPAATNLAVKVRSAIGAGWGRRAAVPRSTVCRAFNSAGAPAAFPGAGQCLGRPQPRQTRQLTPAPAQHAVQVPSTMQALPLGHGGLLGLPLYDKVRPLSRLQRAGGRRPPRAPTAPPLGRRPRHVRTAPLRAPPRPSGHAPAPAGAHPHLLGRRGRPGEEGGAQEPTVSAAIGLGGGC